jgi:hypothetical protein
MGDFVGFGVILIVLDEFASRSDGADLVDEEVLNSLIAVVLASDGVFLENLGDVLLLIRKTYHVNLFVLSLELIGDTINVLH